MGAIIGFFVLIFVLAAITNQLGIAASTVIGRVGFGLMFSGIVFCLLPSGMDNWSNTAVGLFLGWTLVCIPLGSFLVFTAKKVVR